jgi:hypothetical protein
MERSAAVKRSAVTPSACPRARAALTRALFAGLAGALVLGSPGAQARTRGGRNGQAAPAAPLTARAPTGLTVDGRTAPLDVTGRPQFGWLPHDAGGDQTQTAHAIVVRDALSGATLWRSGRVRGAQSQAVTYRGRPLIAGRRYAWTVMTWNRQSQLSPPARAIFDTGLGDRQWSGAQWIRRPTAGDDQTIDYTLARRQFRLRAGGGRVVRAVVYLAAPMRWQLHVNGEVIDTQDDYQTAGENYFDAEDITGPAVAAQRAGGRLAIGVLYGDWAVGEAHPEGPQPYASTLAATAPAGGRSITVMPSTASTCASAPTRSAAFCGAADDWYVGERLGFGAPATASFTTDTIAAIAGDTVTLARPLGGALGAGTAVTSENGPSGLLVKVVVGYAHGRTQTFVSDGSWSVAKDTAELNGDPTMRSTQNAGDYVESYSAAGAQSLAGWDRPGYRRTAVWSPAVAMGRAPLPEPPDCGDYSAPAGKDSSPVPPATATATPVLSAPCGFTHLQPLLAPVTDKLVHPVSLRTLADGNVEADFGRAFVGVPVVRFPHADAADAGNQVTLSASYRLAGTVTTAPLSSGATTLTVDGSAQYPDFTATGGDRGFGPGDPITVDAPADGYGAGHPESDVIAAISGDTITLAAPLRHAHAAGVWVQGGRVGTAPLDTQSTNLHFFYAQDGSPGETTGFYVPMGWRYLQIDGATAADGGRPLSTADVWAVEQYSAASQVGSAAADPGAAATGPDTAGDVPAYVDSRDRWNPASVFTSASGSASDEAATFTSSAPELNAVFTLMERSALYAGQQAYEDSPDRQEGEFTGDGTDESQAQMEDLGESALTRELIVNLIASQRRWWTSGAPAPGSTWGEVNAIYPDNNVSNGNKRDIPDYTEMFPELVWDYYLATGDRGTLRAAYPAMVNVARYIQDNTPAGGQVAGLVCQLASFSSSTAYRFGIIDWPAPDRYNTVVLNSGVDTVVNERAVEVDRALGDAAAVLGDRAAARADAARLTALTRDINAHLHQAGGLYIDGIAVAGSAQDVPGDCAAETGAASINNASQLDQSFAIVDGIAPRDRWPGLGAFIAAQGMKQGPMDLGQLELALVEAGRPAALVRLLTNRDGDGPAKILAEGGTSMWEQWDPGCAAPGGQAGDNAGYNDTECNGAAISQTATDSFSHGWGSVGVYPVTRGLLGITPEGVAGAEVKIAPPSAGLRFARGTEWTPHGPVTVAWSRAGRRSGPEVRLRVTVPDNVTATVALPAGRVAYAASGAGRPRFLRRASGRSVYAVGSGQSTFMPASKGA